MAIPTIIIKAIPRGNDFLGQEFRITKKVDGVPTPINLSGARIFAQFRTNYNGSVIFEFKTDDNSIVITDLENQKIKFMPRNMNYQPVNYISDLKIILADGIDKTYCRFKWGILNVATR